MVEGRLGLEREQGGERAAVHLGEHAPAGPGGLVEQGEILYRYAQYQNFCRSTDNDQRYDVQDGGRRLAGRQFLYSSGT